MAWREMFEYAKENPRISNATDATPHIASKIMNKRQECFVVVTLDGAHQVIKTHLITKGLVNRTLVHPREVYWHAIKDNAAGIIIGHNHPSGSLIPSREDRQVTETIKKAGEIIGIMLLDHVIVSKSGYYSFMEENAL